MTITNQQVKLLMKKLKKNNQEVAAAKSGMDVKTARKYIKSKELPSDQKTAHTWKTKIDPFEDDWDKLKEMLGNAPGLEAQTLMSYLLTKSPEKYKASQLRTMQRRVKDWRAEFGENKHVIFRQESHPGKQSQSDYTCMNSLNITINSNPFKHLLFHFILRHSRWESIKLCFSESFDSLAAGMEKAIWELGGVAAEHRTDNLSAATKAMGNKREFTDRWLEFNSHYNMIPTTNNPGVSHENGAIEKSHDLFKKTVEQALLLRGSRDFSTQKEYIIFLEVIVKTRNYGWRTEIADEINYLLELPECKWNSPIIIRTRVSSASIIQLLNYPYTVPSRLIHYSLTAYIYYEDIQLFYNNKEIQRMPRVYDDSFAGINYRHLIDSLIRKPGAFANYRYQPALFPRLCFKKAYDLLQRKLPITADKHYLKLLQLAKVQSEQEVSDAIELLMEANQLPTTDSVKSLIDVYNKERQAVIVDEPNLADYDQLLSNNGRGVNEQLN
jgi:hypothetical protein